MAPGGHPALVASGADELHAKRARSRADWPIDAGELAERLLPAGVEAGQSV